MNKVRFHLLVFPCLSLFLMLIIAWQNWPAVNGQKHSLIYTYADNFRQGKMGSGFGPAEDGYIPFDKLEPGDIILGGWPDCAYGKYSHAGLYIGYGQVLESYVDCGVCIQSLGHYAEYTRVCLLKVNADTELKARAVARATAYEGQMFYPLAFKGGKYWNCSKIIWKVYADEGIDLDTRKDIWIAPESFCDAPQVSRIFERGI